MEETTMMETEAAMIEQPVFTNNDPFTDTEMNTETERKPRRGRPAGRRNGTKVSKDVRIAVQIATAPKDVRSLLANIFKAPPDNILELVAVVLHNMESVESAIEWLVAESAKTDGMEIALDVSSLYASDPESYQTIAGILADIGAIEPVRKTDLGKAMLPCAQAIHEMKGTHMRSFTQITEVLA